MNSYKQTSYKKKKAQSGVVLIFFVFVLTFVFLPFTAIVIDIGRFILTLRQAQNLADTASTAGLQYLGRQCVSNPLLSCTVPANWASLDGWRSVKPMVRAMAAATPLLQSKKLGSSDYFHTNLQFTPNDQINYQGDQLTLTARNGADVSISVRRGVKCFFINGSGLPESRITWLDGQSQNYCLANTVETKVTISNFPVMLANFMGFSIFPSKDLITVSSLRPYPNSCGQPSCTDIEKFGQCP